jgi:hypothetical protein
VVFPQLDAKHFSDCQLARWMTNIPARTHEMPVLERQLMARFLSGLSEPAAAALKPTPRDSRRWVRVRSNDTFAVDPWRWDPTAITNPLMRG